MSKKRHGTSIGRHFVGGDTTKRVRGSKFTVGSTRISGQYMSRVIFEFAHTGTDPNSRATDEQQAVRDITPIIGALTEKTINRKTKRGLKMVLVDSAVRGQDVTHLQRLGYTVVNYPHAQSNPDGGPGKRLNPTRVEKNHLRTVAVHDDEHGDACARMIYAFGGEPRASRGRPDWPARDQPAEDPPPQAGAEQGRHLPRLPAPRRRLRPHRNNVRATHPAVHTDGPSTDPDYNWGEVCRVFPPTSAAFQYPYGQRNDTEARHTDLRARAKYLPPR
jgi:hypothetical protein